MEHCELLMLVGFNCLLTPLEQCHFLCKQAGFKGQLVLTTLTALRDIICFSAEEIVESSIYSERSQGFLWVF